MSEAFAGSIGTLEIGVIFNTFLYGLVCYQFASYYRTEFNDPIRIKALVMFLFVLDTIHSASVIYMLWFYTVQFYGLPDVLADALWPYTFTPVATAIAALCTQTFLGYRVYRLTQSWYLYAAIMVLALVSFGLGMACGIKAWIIVELLKLVAIDNLVTAWLSFQVFTDVFIAAVLTTALLRSRTGFRRTEAVLHRMIRGAIQTGIFAGIFSMADLATFLRVPTMNLYGMFAIPLGRIYTNTLLDTLLARDELRAALSGTVDMDSKSNSNGRWGASTPGNRTVLSTNPGNIQLSSIPGPIEVHKDVRVVSDNDFYSQAEYKRSDVV